MMLMNCVDVVIPAYNAAEFIEEALESVIAQGGCVARIIVVDDGSSDDTADIVEAFGRRHPWINIECVRQKNSGPSAARNRGLEKAKSEFVALLDADDVWVAGKLRQQLERFHNPHFEHLGVVYCGYGVMSASGEHIDSLGSPLAPVLRGNIWARLLTENLISGSASAVLVRRKCLEDVGIFDESLVCAEDWDLWLRLAEHYTFDYIDDRLVWLRHHVGNSQNDESRMLGGELLFLNKIFKQGNARKRHFERIWVRLEGGGYRAGNLQGFQYCDWRVKILVSPVIIKSSIFISEVLIYGRSFARGIPYWPLKMIYKVYPCLPKYVRGPIKQIWLAVRGRGNGG